MGGREGSAGGRVGGQCRWEGGRAVQVGGWEGSAGGRVGGLCRWEGGRAVQVGGWEGSAGGRVGGQCRWEGGRAVQVGGWEGSAGGRAVQVGGREGSAGRRVGGQCRWEGVPWSKGSLGTSDTSLPVLPQESCKEDERLTEELSAPIGDLLEAFKDITLADVGKCSHDSHVTQASHCHMILL